MRNFDPFPVRRDQNQKRIKAVSRAISYDLACRLSHLATNNSCGLSSVESYTGAANFFEDGFAFRCPIIRLRIGVALVEISVDVFDQLVNRGEAAGSDNILRQIGEEPLDQIEP